jgi:outer membrane protein assembly factor BamB
VEVRDMMRWLACFVLVAAGLAAHSIPPVTWNLKDGTGVVWHVDLPDSSASPLVVGDVIVTLAEPGTVVCLDAATGAERWRREMALTKARTRPPQPGDYGFTLATPVTDGATVYVANGQGLVAAFAVDGAVRWTREFDIAFTGSSPLLVGGRLVFQIGGTTALALDAATGAAVWRLDGLPAGDHGAGSAPAAMRLAETDVLLTAGGDVLRATDGAIMARGIARADCSTAPVVDGDCAYFAFGDPYGRNPQGIEAVRLTRDGDAVTATRLWRSAFPTKGGTTIVEPVVRGDRVYTLVRGNSALHVLDVATGAPIPGPTFAYTSPGHVWRPRPVIAGEYLFAVMPTGETTVVKLGSPWTVVGRCPGAPTGATPVCVGARLYLRTRTGLYCIESTKE